MIDKSYFLLTFIFLSFLIIAEDEKNSLIEVYSKNIEVNSINIVLKDNIDIRNKITSAGSLALKDNIAKKNAAYIKYLPVGIGVFVIFNVLIIFFFINTFENINYNAINSINVISESNTENLGYVLFTDYIVEFEIAGLILLLGILSAIVLTYRKNPNNKYQNPTEQIDVEKKDRLKIIKGLKE